MGSITEQQLSRHRYILMYDDERVLDALLALHEQAGQDWWFLVVDLEAGGYAVGPFSALAGGLEAGDEAYLERQLGEMVGESLVRAEVVVEQAEADLAEALQRAAERDAPAALVVSAGEVRGVLPVGGVRGSTRGVFDTGLAQLAGRYAKLPERGLLSRRRALAAGKRRGSSPPGRRSPGKRD